MFPRESRILIVDDMKTMRLLLKRCLAELGYVNIAEAGDGDAAWTEAQRAVTAGTPYDLIISDWVMPKTKGINLLNRIRQNSKLRGVAFIMLTGENETETIKEAVVAGVNGYMLKPFTTQQLSERLAQVFAVSRPKKSA